MNEYECPECGDWIKPEGSIHSQLILYCRECELDFTDDYNLEKDFFSEMSEIFIKSTEVQNESEEDAD